MKNAPIIPQRIVTSKRSRLSRAARLHAAEFGRDFRSRYPQLVEDGNLFTRKVTSKPCWSRCPHLCAVRRALRARSEIESVCSVVFGQSRKHRGGYSMHGKVPHRNLSFSLSVSLAGNKSVCLSICLSVRPFVRPRLHPFSRLYIVTIHRSYNPADLPDGSRGRVMKTFL